MAKRASFDRNPNPSPNHRYQQGNNTMTKVHPNILASCYVVDASSAALQGFHYSSTGAGEAEPDDREQQGSSGIPEARSGNSSPGSSPPLASYAVSNEPSYAQGRGEGASYAITEECERLFCETMRAVFLGERNADHAGSHVMGTEGRAGSTTGSVYFKHDDWRIGSGVVLQWLELWDYAGEATFRGFVAGGVEGKGLFAFLDDEVQSGDLKHGIMALLELAGSPQLGCTDLVVCVDKNIPREQITALTRDLGWVGFELTTLGPWTDVSRIVSDKWLFLRVET
ncbi:MAG: hypothetical protein M1833_005748 [Piccolia ochrophora]|nr:MAG: hypothetical protein M1833_005748 [Piccolia ochrophora]